MLIKNPSDNYRHRLLYKALEKLNRSDDFFNIIKLTSTPDKIEEIAQPMKYRNVKVAIIGAGLAGLASAYELRKLGCKIHIYEANPKRIGGRVNTYNFTKMLYGELGAMRIPISHETTWHYINLFKLNTIPFIYETQNDILYVNKVRVKGLHMDNKIKKNVYPYYDLNPWEKELPFSKLLEYVYNYMLLQISSKDRYELLTIKPKYPYNINFFDSINFYQAIKLLGLSNGALNLLNSTIGTDRGLFYSSYLELIREIYTVNYSYLYSIKNGNSNLPLAFFNSLKEDNLGNVIFNFGKRIDGIYYNSLKNKVTLKYNYKYYTDYDYVICTIPFSLLRLVDINPTFSIQKMQAIMQMNYVSAQKTLLLCSERFWERTVNNKKVIGGSSITDLVLTSIWYSSTNSGYPYGVITASYNFGLDAIRLGNTNDTNCIQLIKRQLEYIHGLPVNYLNDIVIDYKRINWNCDEYSLGAFSWFSPGQNNLYSYASYLPEFNNRLFFAGEHISPFHGWMQGALQSGMIAANNIAYMLNTTSR